MNKKNQIKSKVKPKLAFTSHSKLREYILRSSPKKISYPCYKCDGKGKVRKEEDRCPIEGYKLAPWYDCGFCNGTGKITKQQFIEYFNKMNESSVRALAEFKIIQKLAFEARKRVTDDELIALLKYYSL